VVLCSVLVKAKTSTLKVKAKAWTFKAKAKATGPNAKACKHTARAEIKIWYAIHLMI